MLRSAICSAWNGAQIAMPPDAVLMDDGLVVPPVVSPWRDSLVRLGLVWLALLLAFATDWTRMFGQWWDSSTYNHVLLVPAILVWLVWLRLPELSRLRPSIWWPALLLVAGSVMLWVLGAFAGFDLFRQAGAVALVPASALLLLGPRIGAGLVFPIGYMAFLVPFGDELVPLLQTVTAKLTIGLVQLSNVPARIDGVFIDTPAGLFEVAEACSGVKFLIAMVALGVLVANVCFRHWGKRVAFIVLCVVAPVLANAVRAWGTIYAAQFVGTQKAAGIDHIIYGWVFFALVIAAVLGLSWRHFDRAIDDPMVDAAAIARSPLLKQLSAQRTNPLLALAGLALLTSGGIAWARAADALSAPLPARIALPDVPGWRRVDYRPQAWWEPRASGADHRLLGRYADAAGREVDVFFALYAAQNEGKEAGGFGEGALRPDSGWAWQGPGPDAPPARSDRLLAAGNIERIAQTYYRSGTMFSGSNMRLKLANIGDRLVLRDRPSMMLILSAEQRPDCDADKSLDAFRKSTGDLAGWMDHVAQLR